MTSDITSSLNPPQKLALRHAKSHWRGELSVLLCLDARLGDLVVNGREPLLTRLKLAWWREALAKDGTDRPKGEPLLAEVTSIEDSSRPGFAATAIQLVDAWEELADPAVVDTDALRRHREGRARAVFASFAGRAAGFDELLAAGMIWAGSEPDSPLPHLGRNSRAFSLLARASMIERAPSARKSMAFFWHALTGR